MALPLSIDLRGISNDPVIEDWLYSFWLRTSINNISFEDWLRSTFNSLIEILFISRFINSLESSVEAEKIMHWANKIFPQVPVFGPLAFDNAISEEAAKIKETPGEVAGKANILVVPNIETGNALVKVMVNLWMRLPEGLLRGGK